MAKQTAQEKYLEMTTAPVERLIAKLAVPTIISMLITTIYNMADTFFIGMISTAASGAVGVAFSVMAIIQALGFFFGQGAGASISQALGSQDTKRANELAATGFFSALICGAAVGVLGLVFMEPLVYFLGATETIYPHCTAYLRLILIGAPWMCASFVLNNLLRFEGNAFRAMVGLTAGGVLNMLLDPLFIFVFDMEIAGAALATIVSQAVSFGILYFQIKKYSAITLRFRDFRPGMRMYSAITRAGLPSLLRQGIASVGTICLNTAARPFGDAAISAMAIIGRITMFSNSAMLGFGQGFQPVCGFNYGAKRYDRVKKGYFFLIKTSVIGLLIFAAVEFGFAEQFVGIFRDDPAVIAIGAKALRFQCITLVLNSFIISSNMLLQTTGQVVPASVLGVARQAFLIPCLWLFTAAFGLTGLQMSQPVADVLTFVIAIPMAVKFLGRLGK
ncbi:MAG: MATE family efflux transporter [Oscillospiraceae bacterium]|nr:MATE family efflux transporter [Oscillospiraceae bacterium]